MLAWLSVWGEMQICICSADAIATHCLLLQLIQIDFTFLVLAHPGSPRHSPEGCKMVGVVVIVVVDCSSSSSSKILQFRAVLGKTG